MVYGTICAFFASYFGITLIVVWMPTMRYKMRVTPLSFLQDLSTTPSLSVFPKMVFSVALPS